MLAEVENDEAPAEFDAPGTVGKDETSCAVFSVGTEEILL